MEASGLAISTLWNSSVPTLAAPVVVADATSRISGSDDFGRCVVDLLAQKIPEVRLVALDQRLTSFLRRRTAIPLDSRAERISTVRLPDSIVGAQTIVGVNDVRQDAADRPTLAIGLWSRFAGARERLGARIGKPEQGLAAEVALAVHPAAIILADLWMGLTVVAATSDQIAAELVGLALRQASRPDECERVGPWQDPLVQRATELHLGVLLPDQMAICMVTEGSTPSDPPTTLLLEIAGRLGVRDVALRTE